MLSSLLSFPWYSPWSKKLYQRAVVTLALRLCCIGTYCAILAPSTAAARHALKPRPQREALAPCNAHCMQCYYFSRGASSLLSKERISYPGSRRATLLKYEMNLLNNVSRQCICPYARTIIYPNRRHQEEGICWPWRRASITRRTLQSLLGMRS